MAFTSVVEMRLNMGVAVWALWLTTALASSLLTSLSKVKRCYIRGVEVQLRLLEEAH